MKEIKVLFSKEVTEEERTQVINRLYDLMSFEWLIKVDFGEME